jgi:stress-induced-phosphoprotein 1
MLMQIMQTDPRFMTVFQVATGIDLGQMQQNQFGNQDKMAEMQKQREEREKKDEEEKEEQRKKDEEDALPSEEKQKIENKRLADVQKDLGNKEYKAKNFELAISLYDKAIELCPEELTYYTNKAAVFFEMKDYDTVIQLCDQAVEISQQGYYDFKKLGKTYARKANALFKQNKFDDSIACYKKAMMEHNDYAFKDALKKVEKEKKRFEDEAYVDPVKSEEHREVGNKLFKDGDFPGAIKEYEEGLKRDPKNVKIYSNKAFAFMKLMEYPSALKDVELGLKIDPSFVKLHVRKGGIHMGMKEYHKAIAAYDEGLKIEPENSECKDGKQKVMVAIQMGSSGGGEDDGERMAKAMADPEIQGLMKDYRVQQLLKEMSENPAAAQAKLQDPFLAEAVNKLIAAGVIKVR